jgi:hypothetical protein
MVHVSKNSFTVLFLFGPALDKKEWIYNLFNGGGLYEIQTHQKIKVSPKEIVPATKKRSPIMHPAVGRCISMTSSGERVALTGGLLYASKAYLASTTVR